MAVRKRQTAWDILTKIVVLTVPTRWMHRSHYFGYVKKGRNFNHAHGQFHTPDLQRRLRRRRRLSIMRSVDILAQATPSAPKKLADPRQKNNKFSTVP